MLLWVVRNVSQWDAIRSESRFSSWQQQHRRNVVMKAGLTDMVLITPCALSHWRFYNKHSLKGAVVFCRLFLLHFTVASLYFFFLWNLFCRPARSASGPKRVVAFSFLFFFFLRSREVDLIFDSLFFTICYKSTVEYLLNYWLNAELPQLNCWDWWQVNVFQWKWASC